MGESRTLYIAFKINWPLETVKTASLFKNVFCIYVYTLFLGDGYKDVTVTADGVVLARLTRKEFIKAFLIQFSALYVYGIDYEKTQNKKSTPKGVKDYFDFCTEYLLGIQPRVDSSGTGIIRKKKTSQGAYTLKESIEKTLKSPQL